MLHVHRYITLSMVKRAVCFGNFLRCFFGIKAADHISIRKISQVFKVLALVKLLVIYAIISIIVSGDKFGAVKGYGSRYAFRIIYRNSLSHYCPGDAGFSKARS